MIFSLVIVLVKILAKSSYVHIEDGSFQLFAVLFSYDGLLDGEHAARRGTVVLVDAFIP